MNKAKPILKKKIIEQTNKTKLTSVWLDGGYRTKIKLIFQLTSAKRSFILQCLPHL